jgi:hypothetical protein
MAEKNQTVTKPYIITMLLKKRENIEMHWMTLRTNFSAAGVSHTSIEGDGVADPCYMSLKLQQLFIFLLCIKRQYNS